jgi:hypothetical protein
MSEFDIPFDQGIQRLHATVYELIKSLCKLHQLDDPAGILDGKPLEIDTVKFTVMHDLDESPDQLTIYTEYGGMPKDRTLAAYAALMQMNLHLHRSGSGVFAESERTGKILLAERFPLLILTPEALSDLLIKGAADAKRWRTHYFLEGQSNDVRQKRTGSAACRPSMRHFLPPIDPAR